MDTILGPAVTVCCPGTWAGVQWAVLPTLQTMSSVANKVVPIISYQILAARAGEQTVYPPVFAKKSLGLIIPSPKLQHNRNQPWKK